MTGIRYLREVDGRYHFSPSPAMRKAGFSNKALGTDFAAAVAYVKTQAEEWEEIRKQIAEAPTIETRGDFHWLVRQFQTDPTWYGSKAPRTQEEMDYAFGIIESYFGPHSVRIVERRHARGFYNTLRADGSAHKARKVLKWFRRLMRYAMEIGVRETNPADEMTIETVPSRTQKYSADEVAALIRSALEGGRASTGNEIPARPSVAVATKIAYDTSLPRQDILAMKWDQWDGLGWSVTQIKARGERKELYLPMSPDGVEMVNAVDRTSIFVIVNEMTGQPYDENVFSRIFRKFRERAGIEGRTFHDLRRTALTEFGEHGGTNVEISGYSGHKPSSPMLNVYVKPDKSVSMAAARKRWGMGNSG